MTDQGMDGPTGSAAEVSPVRPPTWRRLPTVLGSIVSLSKEARAGAPTHWRLPRCSTSGWFEWLVWRRWRRSGQEEWSRGQDPEVIEYVGWCLQGEDRVAIEFAREDAQMRETGDANDPAQAADFEQTRNGIWGWVDDELAVLAPWGVDPSKFGGPIAVWYDPDEKVLPRQHAEWLASKMPRATLATTTALGHRAQGDPRPDWGRLYTWLIAV
jgi:pimeloyl-ACP methyl ester carboxylesterase